MAEATDREGLLLQNLRDAGCNSEMIQQCITLARTQQISFILTLLAKHRKTLLERLHDNQKEIDCLDYLVFSLEHKQY